MSRLALEIFAAAGMLVITLLMAWKAEAWIRLARSPDSAYRLYGIVAKLCLVAGGLLGAIGFLPHADVGEQMMFWIGGSFLALIGAWLLFFRYHRFPPPDDPGSRP